MRQQRIILSIIDGSKQTHPTNSYFSLSALCEFCGLLIKLYYSTKLFFSQNNPAAITTCETKNYATINSF
jgi:hypothetical protein